ncbi:unnamed protein product [Moneuplotes crassus]|uniref:Archaemetzincin-2 n=1 Tax=Euplotes crassus TaxID=5936 RepID=A0AAD1XHT0_EUPCR|nr:unnamed protein product [Moneuplotes crassus]
MESYSELDKKLTKERKKELKKLNEMYIPNDKKTAEALGDIKKEIRNQRIQPVFSKEVVENYHKRMAIVDPGEWIPATEQDSQNYYGFTCSGFNQLYQDRKTIYIQPLDTSMDEEFLATCQKYCEAYFYPLPVLVRAAKNIAKLKIKNRTREEGFIQYDAREILRRAQKWIPADAYCMICILNSDLYPRDSWNFVFGLASLRDRTGVFSFARYDPGFFGEEHGMSDEELKELILFRSIKVMTHEIGHMFGMQHCVYYQCAMNGSMSAEEASTRPVQLCPICLRKLWYNIGFDPLERFKALAEVSDINKYFDETKEWYYAMVEHLESIYSEQKLDKPYKKRYPKNDPDKPATKVIKPTIPRKPTVPKQTGIERLKAKTKK